jgi:hypothetical protein
VRVNIALALRTGRKSCGKIDIVKREQLSRDEKMCAAQIEIGNRRHLQRAARRLVIEIATVGRDQQSRPEKSHLLAAEASGHVGRFSFDSLEINAIRQNGRKPRLGWRRFGDCFVNVDLDCS